tara:strand:+ start:1827 stop:1928 length:102 start_codon:yes stop_codon:yes gene_type:complete
MIDVHIGATPMGALGNSLIAEEACKQKSSQNRR